MAWVRSEYAGELAVVFTWAAALLPWSFSLGGGRVSFVFVRFQWFIVRYIFGADLGAAERPFQTALGAVRFPRNPTVVRAYWVWVAAAALFLVAFALSVVYYLRDDRLEAAAPVDPVRVFGGLLVAVALLHTASVVLLWRGFAGTTVPVGLVFEFVFGGVLLTVERA